MARGEDTSRDPRRKVGRDEFAPPNPSDRVAPYDLNHIISLSIGDAETGSDHRNAVYAGAEEALAQGIPVAPASKFPTVGEVDELGYKAFLPTVMEATKWPGHKDRAPLRGWYEDEANKSYNKSKKEEYIRKNEHTPKRLFPQNDSYGYDSY